MANDTDKSTKRVRELKATLNGHGSMLIVLQDNPDPDAIGAAVGLRRLANAWGVQCSLGTGAGVGRAENRAMVSYLDLNLRDVRSLEPERFDILALVDTQPGTGNNSLPAGQLPEIVIDHHPIRRETRSAEFTDIRRRYGATSTILTEYLLAEGIVPEPPLATALLYGIRSDTQDFGRESTQADMNAFETLYPLANKRVLGAIQRGQVPGEYFKVISNALDNARLCGSAIYSPLGAIENADMVAEVADLLLRHEQARWSCCWAQSGDRILLSVRSSVTDPTANELAHKITHHKGSGGGHSSMAGGQLPLPETATGVKKLETLIRRRFLEATGNEKAPCRRLT